MKFLILAMLIDYAAPPTLWRFMQSDAFVRACVGPVGSGKSSACVMEILRRAAAQAPNAQGKRCTRWAVVRNTYRELSDTTRKTFEQWLGALGRWNETSFAFGINKPCGDGTSIEAEILFRALDRPGDVKKLLSLELTGAYLNEGREIAHEVFDGMQHRVGRFPAKRDGGPTWSGMWLDTNPWATSHWGYELFSATRPEGHELFEQPSGLGPDAENVANLPDGYYRRIMAGKDREWIAEYLEGKYPRADKGSVYGELLEALKTRGGVGDFSHPRDGVFVVFDLGYSDGTAMWFFRLDDAGLPVIIDWDEYSGIGLSEDRVVDGSTRKGGLAILRERGYKYARIILPHDARAHSLQTGISTVELFSAEYPGRVTIAPELSLVDGIGAVRWLLEQPIRVHSRCAEGLRRLGAYRYQWDEERKVYKKTPVHDWASHTADSFRYLACSARPMSFALAKPPAEKGPPPNSIEALFQAHYERLSHG